MKTVYYLPIEPLEERYTKQWYLWFPKKFRQAGFNVNTIDGRPLTDKIKSGEFLDTNSTLSYKASQLEQIGKLFFEKKVNRNDIFFVADLEFWGIESIKYLSVLNDIPVKIFGFMHAGSYDKEDFFRPCHKFARHFEEGWFHICDKVFVGSNFHKGMIVRERKVNPKNIIVVGNPWDTEGSIEMIGGLLEKKNRIIHTNLPDYRKRPNIFLNLVPILKKRLPDVELMVTTSRDDWGIESWIRESAQSLSDQGMLTIKTGINKKEYYTLLAESKVMFSATEQETFGYCIVEAMTFDTIPIIPNRLSCPELVDNDKKLIYNNYTEAVSLIVERYEDEPIPVKQYAEKYNNTIDRIIKYF